MSRSKHRKKSMARQNIKRAAAITTAGAVLAMVPLPAMAAEDTVELVKQYDTVTLNAQLPPVPEAAPVVTTMTGDMVVSEARKYLGSNYLWGGESSEEGGFDCSGLIFRAYANLGINVPRTSSELGSFGTAIGSIAEAQAGDILYWPGHVGIYVGNGQMIDSSTPGTQVSEKPIWGTPSVRRVLTGTETVPTVITEEPVVTEVVTNTVTVQQGDYLSKIAPTVGISWQTLYQNNIEVIGDNPDRIFPGQILSVGGLPLPEVAATVEEVPTETPVTGTAIIENSAGPVAPSVQAAADRVYANVLGASLIKIGGTRSSAIDPDGHPSGRALDYMVMADVHLGDSLVSYHVANWDSLGVEYIIWEQRILNSPDGVWELMPDRGSATANHRDHVHVNYR